MEIPQNELNKFKCCICHELLLCGPVFMIHETGRAVCGRCNNLDSESKNSIGYRARTRNEQYEAAAKFLVFPCKNTAQGCTVKMYFSVEKPNIHEKLCTYNEFVCPLVPVGNCDWIGTSRNLKEHCEEKHSSQLFDNPCSPPRPDLTISKLYTYLISALRHIFLLHIKVCVTSGKLYYSIRMFAEKQHLINYSFAFNIEGNSSIISKSCSLLPTDLLTIQESSPNCISINNLLETFNGKYNDTKFTIIIKTLLEFCLNCEKPIENITDLKYCDECKGKLNICKFRGKGCLFVDFVKAKCEKHENYFCEYQKNCLWCGKDFISGLLIEHLEFTYHSTIKTIRSCIDSHVNIYINGKDTFILFFSYNVGIIICKYKLINNNFTLRFYTSLPSQELKKFKCSFEVINSCTSIIKEELLYNNDYDYDWYIDLTIVNIDSFRNVTMKINIDKI